MDERHKALLRRNRAALVTQLRPETTYEPLMEKQLFTRDMIHHIQAAGSRRDQARELVRDLETRGSRAFPLFLEILQQTGHRTLVQALQGGDPQPGPLQPLGPPAPRPLEPLVPTAPRPLQPLGPPAPRPLEPLVPTAPRPLQPLGPPAPRPLEPLGPPAERPLQSVAPLPLRPLPLVPTPAKRPLVHPLPIVSPLNVEKQKEIVPLTPTQTPSSVPTPSPDGEFLKPRPMRVRRDSIQSYKMDATPCGHCLIINNVEFQPRSELNDRSGSDVDCERLQRRFQQLNFIVDVKTNLKQRQIKQELSALSKKDHSEFDCCVVVILSHGTEVSHNRFPGAVYGVDGLVVPVQLVTNFLNGQHCPSLQGKPKLFFIQACGGGEKDTGFEVSPEDETAPPGGGGEDDQTDSIPISSSSDSLSMSDEPDARTTLPTPSDILVSYSTFPGYVSWRDPRLGSWYVETLDQILAENAATDDLVTMLMMVNHEVSQNSAKGLYKQMPGSFNFLRKLLYFQPQPN